MFVPLCNGSRRGTLGTTGRLPVTSAQRYANSVEATQFGPSFSRPRPQARSHPWATACHLHFPHRPASHAKRQAETGKLPAQLARPERFLCKAHLAYSVNEAIDRPTRKQLNISSTMNNFFFISTLKSASKFPRNSWTKSHWAVMRILRGDLHTSTPAFTTRA